MIIPRTLILSASLALCPLLASAQTIDHPSVAPMVTAINAERARFSLPPLAEDARLDALAEAHEVLKVFTFENIERFVDRILIKQRGHSVLSQVRNHLVKAPLHPLAADQDGSDARQYEVHEAGFPEMAGLDIHLLAGRAVAGQRFGGDSQQIDRGRVHVELVAAAMPYPDWTGRADRVECVSVERAMPHGVIPPREQPLGWIGEFMIGRCQARERGRRW